MSRVTYHTRTEKIGGDSINFCGLPSRGGKPLSQEFLPDVPLRRSIRDRQPSTRYSTHEYVLLTVGGEPECYAEAMENENKKEWVDAMQDEMKSLHENNTFELVKLPKEKRALKNRWYIE